jgi:hypothetical protein
VCARARRHAGGRARHGIAQKSQKAFFDFAHQRGQEGAQQHQNKRGMREHALRAHGGGAQPA